jgi:hypothetical protein
LVAVAVAVGQGCISAPAHVSISDWLVGRFLVDKQKIQYKHKNKIKNKKNKNKSHKKNKQAETKKKGNIKGQRQSG